MPLNGEEKYQQKKFEQNQYARLTDDQKKIKLLNRQLKHAQDSVRYYEAEMAELEEQLRLVRNTNDHINNELDKRVLQIDQINGHIRHYERHERSAGITLDNIRAVLR